MKMTLKNSI